MEGDKTGALGRLNFRSLIEFGLSLGASALCYLFVYGFLQANNWIGLIVMAGTPGLFVLLFLLYVLPYGAAIVVFLIGAFQAAPWLRSGAGRFRGRFMAAGL